MSMHRIISSIMIIMKGVMSLRSVEIARDMALVRIMKITEIMGITTGIDWKNKKPAFAGFLLA